MAGHTKVETFSAKSAGPLPELPRRRHQLALETWLISGDKGVASGEVLWLLLFTKSINLGKHKGLSENRKIKILTTST